MSRSFLPNPRLARLSLSLALVLVASACGDEASSECADARCVAANNGTPNNGSTNNGSTNNGTPNNGTPNNGATNNGTTNNGATNNGATNNGATNNGATNNGTTDPDCPAPTPFDVGATYANEVRVPAGGDLESAIRSAGPGTRVVLEAGSHPGGISAADVQGTQAQPIAIVGEDGAVISGGATGLQLSDPAWVVLENLTVEGASANGFNIDDGGDYATPAHHVVIRDVTVSNIGNGGNQDCIKLSGLDDFHIEGVDLSGCSGQSIDMVGCHDGFITSSTIHDTPGAGVQAKGGTADVTVHAVWFEDVDGRAINLGGSTGLQFFRPIDAPHEAARIKAYANVIVRPGETAAAYVGCDACEVINNTIVHPQRWVARVLQETTDARFVPSRDGIFANNIIVFRSSVLRTFVNVGPNAAPDTFTFRHNLWWDLDNAGFGGPTLTDGLPAEQNGIVGDPGFDANGSNFTLTTSSPAAGAAQGAPALADHAGECWAQPPAIGAYEAPQ